MRQAVLACMLGSVVLLVSAQVRGEVTITVDRNEGEATAAFRFERVPQPSGMDAGNRAKFRIIDGERDRSGGDVDRLNDGRWPSEADQPSANFFFRAGTDGGRILVELAELIEVRQVNTYSWHPSTRGPQVYRLYGSDGTGEGFLAIPARQTEPEGAGWKLIASVDTRPAEGQGGGQYGVSIAEASGSALGRFRYLLLDVFRTEDADAFGNTFFSEIDVVDGKDYPALAAAPVERKTSTLMVAGKYEIVFDTSEVPEIEEWVETKLKPICAEWYPKIVEMLPSEGYSAPERFSIIFHREMRGVANAGGGRINCAGEWFKRNLDGEAAGAVVHEMVHIVQQYRRARGGNRNPGWLVEGLADYIRWFNFEPESARPRPNPARANYNDSYRTTGHFLNYLTEKHGGELVKKLNAAMREGRYTEELWTELTGKTAEELGAEWKESLPARISGAAGGEAGESR